jgi:hypothetical protein
MKEELFSSEEISDIDADFIVEIYNAVVSLKNKKKPVTISSIAKAMKIRNTDLLDFLPEITQIVYRVEQEI